MSGIAPFTVNIARLRETKRPFRTFSPRNIGRLGFLQFQFSRRFTELGHDEIELGKAPMHDSFQVRNPSESPFFYKLWRDFLHFQE